MAVTINASTSAGLVQTADLSGSLQLQTAGTTAVTVNSSQNVGIGTTSPSYKLTVKGGNATSALIDNDGSQFTQLLLQRNSTANTGGDILIDGTNSQFQIRSLLAGPIAFHTSAIAGSPTEAARIDSSGNLLVGTTSVLGSAKLAIKGTSSALAVQCDNGSSAISVSNTSGTSNYNAMVIYNNTAFGTIVGSINCSGSTTNFNTSSDYRLKENIKPMTGALEKVQALKPVTYKWKTNGSDGQGFIAHELQAVVPDCVTGEKDAVDADGKPVHQGIDTSFLVATLTKAIQEQQALIESLTTRLTALEAK